MISERTIREFLNRDLDNFDWLKDLSASQINSALAELVPSHLTEGLWLHQKAALLIMQHQSRFIYHIGMGGGKTLLSLTLLKQLKLRGENPKAVVFVPYLTAVDTWINETQKFAPELKCCPLLGSSAENYELIQTSDANLFPICYQSAVALVTTKIKKTEDTKGKWLLDTDKVNDCFGACSVLVMDEIHKCFIAGTKVDTPTGSCSIEQIKVGDLVETSEGIKKVSKTFIHYTNAVVRLVLNNGHVIVCTPEHPIFTDKGWVEARNTQGAYVYNNQALSNLRERIQSKIIPQETNDAKILRSQLFSKMEDVTARNTGEGLCTRSKGKVQGWFERIFCLRGEQRSQGCQQQKNDGKKPSTYARGNRKVNENKRKEGHCKCMDRKTWGQWNWTYRTTKTFIGSIRKWLETRVCGALRQAKNTWVPNKLQNRCSQPDSNDWNRVRWTCIPTKDATQNKEGYKTTGIRVDNVSFEKQGHTIPVYNIEVTGPENYFAEGILVHNCKGYNSTTFQLCNQISQHADYVYGLTGTPFGKDLQDLWAEFYVIDFGETLGPNISFFREVFFTKKYPFWGGVKFDFKKKYKRPLQRMIKNRSIHYAVTEFADMPEKQYIQRRVNMHDTAKAHVEKAKRDLQQAALDKDYEVAGNAFMQLRQLSSGFITFKDDEDRIKIKLDHNPKLDLLCELIDEMPPECKMVVFHDYIHTNHLISERLTKLKIPHARIWGGQKDPIGQLKKFREDSNCRFLIINSKSGSSALNLQFANFVVFFEVPSVIDRNQAEARCYRPGQSRTVFIYDLFVNGTIDEEHYTSIKEGGDFLSEFLSGKQKVKS